MPSSSAPTTTSSPAPRIPRSAPIARAVAGGGGGGVVETGEAEEGETPLDVVFVAAVEAALGQGQHAQRLRRELRARLLEPRAQSAVERLDPARRAHMGAA